MQDICGKVILTTQYIPFLDFSKTKAWINETRKQFVTLHNPEMYPHTKFWIPTSHIIQILSRPDLSRTVVRGQCHRDPKTVGGTSWLIDESTYQI